MNEADELPAVYRSLSVEALSRLLEDYRVRRSTVRGTMLLDLFGKRIGFLEAEIARRDT